MFKEDIIKKKENAKNKFIQKYEKVDEDDNEDFR